MNDVLIDQQGRRIPRELCKETDVLRDDLVRGLVKDAHTVSRVLAAFKRRALDDIAAFVQLSAERHGVHVGGHKGNLTLYSFDGNLRIERQVASCIVFDEGLQIAKELIDDLIREWANGSRAEVRALLEGAFKTDSEGKVSTSRVLSLRKLNIEDERWLKAMKVISDSILVASTKTYLRLYERDGVDGAWRPVSLDLASAEVSS